MNCWCTTWPATAWRARDAGLYVAAIRLGQEQVPYGQRSGARNSRHEGTAALAFLITCIGMASEAAACAAALAGQFVNTPKEHLLGFIENVHGLALHALGRWTEAVERFPARPEGEQGLAAMPRGRADCRQLGMGTYDRGDSGWCVVTDSLRDTNVRRD